MCDTVESGVCAITENHGCGFGGVCTMTESHNIKPIEHVAMEDSNEQRHR